MPVQEIVHVRHPYRMELRRKRKRTREQWLVAARTPVDLRIVDPASVGPAVVVPGHGDRPPLTWRPHGGDLWYEVAGVRLDRGAPPPWSRFGPGTFVDFLSGKLGLRDVQGTDLLAALTRTPVVAGRFLGSSPGRGYDWGGHGLGGPEMPVSEVYHDGSAEAVRALHAFMDDCVAIAGDKVLLKVGDPLFAVRMGRFCIEPFPRSRILDRRGPAAPLGYRLDRLEAGLSWERDAFGSGHRAPSTEDWGKGFEAAPGSRETLLTLAVLASVSAFETYELFRSRECCFASGSAECDAVEALDRRAVSSWARYVDATLGAIDLRGAPEAVEEARNLLQQMQAFGAMLNGRTDFAAELAGYVRRFEEFEWPASLAEDHLEADLRAFAMV